MKRNIVSCGVRTRIIPAVVVLAAALGLAGCPSTPTKQGIAQLETAKNYYRQNNTAAAIQSLSSFLQANPNSTQTPQAYYLRGLCYRQQGYSMYAQADQDFQHALKGGDAETRGLSLTALGHNCFESQPPKLVQAADYYQKALPLLKKEPPKDAVLYRLGVSLQRLGKWDKADPYLSQCFDEFPNSEYTAQARNQFGTRAFTIQLGAFSTLENAKKMIQKASQAGYEAQWFSRKSGSKLLYIVHHGRYSSYDQAQNDKQSLSGKGFNAMVIPLSQSSVKPDGQ